MNLTFHYRPCLSLLAATITVFAGTGLGGAELDRAAHLSMSVSAPEDDNSVEAELASFELALGYEANLFADETDGIANPVCMAWDSAGRLWVLITSAYPQLEQVAPPNDQLLILEDTDKYGRADQTTVFADGLNMPTGFALGHGGAYVGEGNDLIHLSDTNGDGKADTRRLVFTGFGTGDTHQNINSFTWSPGGELLFCQGLHSFARVETPWGISRLDEHGSWRLRPLRRQLHGFSRSSSGGNPWGILFGNWGEAFIKSNGPQISELIPAMVWSDVPGIQQGGGVDIGRTEIKSMIMAIPESPHLPEDIQGDLLIAGYFAHVIDRLKIYRHDSGHRLENIPPLMRSTHSSFRPVDIHVGPDGALYVADWFNPIIGHYQASLRHPDRDKTHGRIWRVTATGRPLAAAPDFSQMAPPELCEQLRSSWRYVRYQAKRRLADLPVGEVIPAMDEWIDGLASNEMDLARLLYEAIGVYESHEVVNRSLLERLLKSEEASARAYAARVVGRWSDRIESPLELLDRYVNDEDSRVRLEAVVACSEIRSSEALMVAARVVDHPMDRFINHALTTFSRALAPLWLPALEKGTIAFDDPSHLVFVLRANGGKESIASVRSLLKQENLGSEARSNLMALLAGIGSSTDLRWVLDRAENNAVVLDGFIETADVRELVPEGDLAPVLSRMLDSKDLEIQLRAVRLAGLWSVNPTSGRVKKILLDRGLDPSLRAAVIETHSKLRGQDAVIDLISMIDDPAPVVRVATVQALCQLDLDIAAEQAVLLLKNTTSESAVEDLVTPFLGYDKGPSALAAVLGKEPISAEFASRIRAVMGAAGRFDPALDQVLRPVLEAGTVGLPEYSESYVRDLSMAVEQLGDAEAGAKVYASAGVSCVACHRIGKEGGVLGPELTAVGAGVPVEQLIEAVLWPDRQIKEGYAATTVVTKNGRTISGYVDVESRFSIVIRDAATGTKQTIAVKQVATRLDTGTLMPPGLTASLSHRELRDLIRFLAEQKGRSIHR